MAESAPDLDRFTYDQAWEVGSALVARSRPRCCPG